MLDTALPNAAFKAQIKSGTNLPTLAAGQTVFHPVKVKNVSPHLWAVAGDRRLNVSYHWLDKNGQPVLYNGIRTAMPLCLAPGQEVEVECLVEVPDTVGQYDLEFDVVQEYVSWFKERGSETCKVPCQVAATTPTHRLKFTGRCTEAEFRAACAQQPWWYHSYYFDNGFHVIGDYDIGKNIDEYGFPADMTGLKVLDIGTASGWFAHYFTQRGAQVTAVDIRGSCDYDEQGRFLYPPVESIKPVPDRTGPRGEPLYYSRVSRGLWIMQELLGTQIRYVNARAYDVRPELFGGEKFDLVFIGALLLHLRDPIGALMAARSVCGGRLIATTRTMIEHFEDPQPRMELVSPKLFANWWYPNKACYRRWFLDAGFREVEVERTVTLTAERAVPCPETPGGIRNASQRLQVAVARI